MEMASCGSIFLPFAPVYNAERRHAEITKTLLTIDGASGKKRLNWSALKWIHSDKLCLLLGNTILQEVFCAYRACACCLHTGGPFLWRDGRRQVWRSVSTGEGLKKHLNPLFECFKFIAGCVTLILKKMFVHQYYICFADLQLTLAT